MKRCRIYKLLFLSITLTLLSACTKINDSNEGLKKKNEINYTWKVIDAYPKKDMDISGFGEEDGTIFFEKDKFYGGYKVSKGYEKFKESHPVEHESEFKDLDQFNKALRSVGYKAKNMDNFFFFEDTIEESEMCFVLVDKGEKLILVTPLNIWSEEQNYGAILFKKLELRE